MSKNSGNHAAYIHSYAKAIFALARGENDLQKWLDILQTLSIVTQAAGVINICSSPQFSLAKRNYFLQQFCSAAQIKSSAEFRNLTYLLLANHHLALASQIFTTYQKMVDKHNAVITAEIVSAHPLNENMKQELTGNLLRRYACHNIKLQHTVQPKLLAGLLLRVQGEIIDASLHNQLHRLQKHLSLE